MSATIRMEYLLSLLRAEVGDNSSDDLMRRWIEECYSYVMDQPWVWNFTDTRHRFSGTISEDGCFWNDGDDYITTADPVSIGLDAAGMCIKINDVRYRVIDAGFTDPNRIYLSGELTNTGSDQTLVFYQERAAFKTVNISSVDVLGDTSPKLVKIDKRIGFMNPSGKRWTQTSKSRPYHYIVHEDNDIRPPEFPPLVVTNGSGSVEQGRYLYFYTRYDTVSGLESAPGPQVEYINEDGREHLISYSNPAGDKSEWGSYKLRLYRSDVNPGSDRVPMYLVEERTAEVAAGGFVDTNSGKFRNKKRYWDGPHAIVEPYPSPDSKILLEVFHVNSQYYRLEDQDILKMGRNITFKQALLQFMLAGVSLSARSHKAYMGAMATFRRQVSYMLQNEADAAQSDVAAHEYRPGVIGPAGAGISSHADFFIASLRPPEGYD